MSQPAEETTTHPLKDGSSKANKTPHGSLRTGYKRWLLGLMPIAFMALLSVGLFLLRHEVRQFQEYGYAGVFIITLLNSATVVMPVPGLAIVFIMGSVLNPALVGVVGGVGAAIGELGGYAAGYGGSIIVDAQKWARYRQFEGWLARKGAIVVFLAACVPNPLFDIVGMAAGAMRMPVWKFLLAVWPGTTVKNLVTAVAGYYGFQLLLRFIT